jgi:hypothetical protein
MLTDNVIIFSNSERVGWSVPKIHLADLLRDLQKLRKRLINAAIAYAILI